jgi:hypothetical protein
VAATTLNRPAKGLCVRTMQGRLTRGGARTRTRVRHGHDREERDDKRPARLRERERECLASWVALPSGAATR